MNILTGMWSPTTPVKSRTKCPHCGSSLYYMNTLFSFFTGLKKRACQTSGFGYVDPGQFKAIRH